MSSAIANPSVETSTVSSSKELPKTQYLYWLVFLTLLATLLRFYNLGGRGFWEDEGYTWNFVRLPWGYFLRGIVTRAADMTVYYVAMKFWVQLGSTEFAMRSFSALFSIATVPVIGELASRLFSRRAGIIAAAVLSVHAFSIHYAQETRSYALVMFLAALGWLQLTKAVHEPTRRNWILFSLICLLEVYSHFISGMNVVAQFVTLCFLPAGTLRRRPLAWGTGILGIGLIPGIVYTLDHFDDGAIEWVKRTDWSVLRGFMESMAGMPESGFRAALFTVILAGAAVLFFITLAQKRRSIETFAYAVPVIGFLLPVVAIILISIRQPVFVTRYLSYLLIPLVLAAAAVCARLKPLPSALVALTIFVLLATALPAYYREPSTQDFRGVAQYIQMRQQPGDALIAWRTMAKPSLDFYASRGPAFPEYLYPKVNKYYLPMDQLVRPDPYTLPKLVKEHNRIWVVYTLDTSPLESGYVPPLYVQRIVERTHRLLSVRQFRNLRVEEYSY